MGFITEFNQTGECVIDVNLVIENWTDAFAIFGHKGDEKTKYTFVVHENRKEEKPETKCQISEIQANEIIEKLNLIRFDDLTFRRAFSFRNRHFYLTEIVRLGRLCIKEKNNSEMQGAIQYAKEVIKAYSHLI